VARRSSYAAPVAVPGVGWPGWVEFVEESADALGGAAVSFDLAGPAAFGGVGDELFLGVQPILQAGMYCGVVTNLGQVR
jgi:hypothetical protein